MGYCEFQQLQKPTLVKEISLIIVFSSCKKQTGEFRLIYIFTEKKIFSIFLRAQFMSQPLTLQERSAGFWVVCFFSCWGLFVLNRLPTSGTMPAFLPMSFISFKAFPVKVICFRSPIFIRV